MAPTLPAKSCIVCGQGSHRADWQGQQYPACDSHTKAEVQLASQKPLSSVPSQSSKTATPIPKA
jgi:hypothetical protein